MSVLPPINHNLNPMNFTENQQGNVILEKLRLQRENSKFCDVTLIVDKNRFKLHRNILASFSPYFEKLLLSSRTTQEKFTITGHNHEIFQYFVNYIYTGSIIIHSDNVYELLKLSHKLEVLKLKMYCAEYLERNMDIANCLKVRDAAVRYGLHSVGKQAVIFTRNNLNDVLSHKEILKIDVSCLKSFVLDMGLELSTVQIFRLILDWLRYDVRNRELQLKHILDVIKLTELDLQYINDIMEGENVFASSEISLYLILKRLSDNGLTLPKFHGVLEVLNHKYGVMTFQDERPDESQDKIHKMSPTMERRKKKRLLRRNPIARLAALRSVLLLRRKKLQRDRKSMKQEAIINMKLESLDETNGNADAMAQLKCHLCDHFSADTTSLEQHLSAVHSRDVTYKCGVCGYVCQWNNLYLEHVRGHFPGPPYKCDSCDFSNEKLNLVMAHRSVHLEEKTYRCLQCSFRTRTHASLVTHSKLHNSTATPSEKSNQMNSECRNYVCDLCGFNTRYLSHLIAHKRIHSGDIYRCSYPHCKFTTGKKTQLGSHAKSHQGVRPHCCQICGRGFLEKSHLVRHERIHLEEKPFKCHECDYASSRRDKLKEHQARHHGDNASAKVPYKARPNKKSSQMYQDTYSPGEVRGQPGTSSDIQEVLVQHHNLPAPIVTSYPPFSTSEPHHHNTATTAATLEFHQQQLLSTSSRAKEHRPVPQTTAAAVTAAMMLDPRFHHTNVGPNSYGAPVGAPAGPQVNQAGHHVEYPTALMSLF